MCEKTQVEEITNFQEVPEGGNEEVEATQFVDGKTQFTIDTGDYAVIARENGIIEQIIPHSLRVDGTVSNDNQAFYIFCSLIFTSQDQDEKARKLVEQIFAFDSEVVEREEEGDSPKN